MTLTDPQTQRIMDALAIADIRLGMGGSGATKDEVDAIRGAIGIFPEHDFIPSDLEGERMTARELATAVFDVLFVNNDYKKAIKLIEAHDAEVRAEGGDGTPEQPFRATYNPKCFQRHDAELYAKICERDDGFEITVIPPRTGPTRHYRIDATGSWADLARPGEDKTLPLEMLLSIAGVSEPAATETTTEFCARIAAKYGYKVEEP